MFCNFKVFGILKPRNWPLGFNHTTSDGYQFIVNSYFLIDSQAMSAMGAMGHMQWPISLRLMGKELFKPVKTQTTLEDLQTQVHDLYAEEPLYNAFLVRKGTKQGDNDFCKGNASPCQLYIS